MSDSSRKRTHNVNLVFEELEPREMPSVAAAGSDIIVGWSTNNPVIASFATDAINLGNNTYQIDLKAGVSTTTAVDWYRGQIGVSYAELDNSLNIASVPNDTFYNQQWALNAVNASTAWNYTTGSKSIIVAVIDTGIDYNNPELAGNMWSGLGYNFLNNNNNPMDDNGHGTAVAGIIGAIGNNQNGIAGINWNVQLMDLKFMDSSGVGSTANAIRAINFAVAHGAKIINESWEGTGSDPALYAAIQNAYNHGVIVVNAAGNSAENLDNTPEYPANYILPNVLNVAATDQNNNLASFSNYGINAGLDIDGCCQFADAYMLVDIKSGCYCLPSRQ